MGRSVSAAAYSRAFTFCGGDGVELLEPLGFKGRRGSGIAGRRDAYADEVASIALGLGEIRILLPGVGTPALQSGRPKRRSGAAICGNHFRPGRRTVESALANASRILPIITTAHGASAGNNTYWPEVYTNQPIVDPAQRHPYTDSPAPKVFGTVSPLDPQLFSRINDFAGELVKGERSGKYSPVEVAHGWRNTARRPRRALTRRRARDEGTTRARDRRLTIDIARRRGPGPLLRREDARRRAVSPLRHDRRSGRARRGPDDYRAARDVWTGITPARRTSTCRHHRRRDARTCAATGRTGWRTSDADIAAVAAKLDGAKPAETGGPIARAIAEALGRRYDPRWPDDTRRPASIRRDGAARGIGAAGKDYDSVQLHYRRVNHAERWKSVDMQADGRCGAVRFRRIRRSPFPLQSYFE